MDFAQAHPLFTLLSQLLTEADMLTRGVSILPFHVQSPEKNNSNLNGKYNERPEKLLKSVVDEFLQSRRCNGVPIYVSVSMDAFTGATFYQFSDDAATDAVILAFIAKLIEHIFELHTMWREFLAISVDAIQSYPRTYSANKLLFLRSSSQRSSKQANRTQTKSPSISSKHRSAYRKYGLGEDAVALLREWLEDHFDHPYPDFKTKQRLLHETKLTPTQLASWFVNARRRIIKRAKEASENIN